VDPRILLVVMDEQAGVESAVNAVSSIVMTVGGHWELQMAALLKAYGGVCVLQAC